MWTKLKFSCCLVVNFAWQLEYCESYVFSIVDLRKLNTLLHGRYCWRVVHILVNKMSKTCLNWEYHTQIDLKRVHKSCNLYPKISETFLVYIMIISMTTNMISMIAKPETTMIRSYKSLEVSSPSTTVPCVVLIKKITKNKTDICSVLLILPYQLGHMAPMIWIIWSICGRLWECSHITTNPSSAEHTRHFSSVSSDAFVSRMLIISFSMFRNSAFLSCVFKLNEGIYRTSPPWSCHCGSLRFVAVARWGPTSVALNAIMAVVAAWTAAWFTTLGFPQILPFQIINFYVLVTVCLLEWLHLLNLRLLLLKPCNVISLDCNNTNVVHYYALLTVFI